MERSLIQYVLNRLSLLSDEELASLDYDSSLNEIGKNVNSSVRAQFVRIFDQIQRELPIYHHGVKGMKWGVRRYQNKDGSLTPAGKKRLADEKAKESIFGTAQKFQVRTRNGEIITAQPIKPWSLGKKVFNSLLGVHEKDVLGYRGDANYSLFDSAGNCIGELSLISKNADVAYGDWITIYESHRGKGYATDIINGLITKAKDSGYSKIEINALKKPRPLYERLGFTYSDRSQASIISRIMEYEFGCKRMEYDLRSIKHSECAACLYHSSGMDIRIMYGMKFVAKHFNDLVKE